jgi:tight adherence protein B
MPHSSRAASEPVTRFGRRNSRRKQSETGEVSAIAERLASLLRSGVPSSRALLVLTESHDDLNTVSAINIAKLQVDLLRGMAVSTALASRSGQPWRAMAALWFVAEHGGAPVADACERVVVTLTALEKIAQRRRVLLAGPQLTLLLVSALPALAVAFGQLLGFRPLLVLLSPIGVPLLLVGTLFFGCGVLWTRGMIRKVAEHEQPTGLEFELVSLALRSGMSLSRARRLTVDALDRFQVKWADPRALRDGGSLTQLLARVIRTGEMGTRSLIEQAAQIRRAAMTDMEARAEKLAIHTLIPLSVCILPSFVTVGILPIVISMLGVVVS